MIGGFRFWISSALKQFPRKWPEHIENSQFAAPSAGVIRLRFKGSSSTIWCAETLSPLGLPCMSDIFRPPITLVNRENDPRDQKFSKVFIALVGENG